MYSHIAPPPPKLAWAPTLAMVVDMQEGDRGPFFVTVVDTPCGRATFVNRWEKIRIDGDRVIITVTHERYPCDTPTEEQQWVSSTLSYAPSTGVTPVEGEIVASSEPFMDDVPDCFMSRPADLTTIVGYAESLLIGA
jgi:hypothetical protein